MLDRDICAMHGRKSMRNMTLSAKKTKNNISFFAFTKGPYSLVLTSLSKFKTLESLESVL